MSYEIRRVQTFPSFPEIVDDVISDYFAFQAAACTTQSDCQCGRHDEWPDYGRDPDEPDMTPADFDYGLGEVDCSGE